MDDRARPGPHPDAPNPPAAASAAPAQTSRPAADAPANAPPKVQQPKPQALPSRTGPSSILVSPRQKGNPILNGVRAVAWEYSDIPADYVLGATTCALFLSLKYHRLHPEYIYNRIRDLRGQYNLRILLTMVDIENHEESLRELSKTSLINNVTIMLCWSAQEAGRYLELFKNFENAAPTSIRAQQSSSYSDKLVEFITVPRSINKTDAVGLASNFGSIRTAVNAGPEEVALIAGWGEKKVQRWCNAVREPFRIKKAARRGVGRDDSHAAMSKDIPQAEGDDQTLSEPATRLPVGNAIPVDTDMPLPGPSAVPDADRRPARRFAEENPMPGPEVDSGGALRKVEHGPIRKKPRNDGAQRPDTDRSKKAETEKEDLSEGIVAALSKLRQQ
jgi:DNA excision repair protein ERCC-1